jgi:hypothetical protein
MQPRMEIIVFVAVIAVAFGEPIFDKLHPNRDERFQIKDAGRTCQISAILTTTTASCVPAATFTPSFHN